jgi:thiol-disulfide isomerase/thioredoxin
MFLRKSYFLLISCLLATIFFTSFKFEIPKQSQSEFIWQPKEFYDYINSHKEDTLLINFWATWCRPCVEEMPDLTQVIQEKNIKHLIVSLDDASISDAVQKFIKSRNWDANFILLDITDFNTLIDKIDKDWEGVIPMTILYVKNKSYSHYNKFENQEEIINFLNK